MATRDEVLAVLRSHGKSVRQWAEDNNFSPANVRSVIYSNTLPKRGEKYRIARVLGMIAPPVTPLPSVYDEQSHGVSVPSHVPENDRHD